VGSVGAAVGAALRRRTPEDASDRQPAASADGELVLVGDIRLDNRSELAAGSGLRDDVSTPDSALVLAAYDRWGRDVPRRLHGSFAFALLDRRRGGALLARDHMGSQPLVVHERRGTLAFCSTALGLTALEGVGRTLDLRRAAEVLALALASERTFVEGVRWLPAGGALWADATGVRRWRWWQPDLHATRDRDSAAVFAREMRAALETAVEARLRSARGVGGMTSGGLDSPSVAATAADILAPQTFPAYTSAPPPGWTGAVARGWEADESPLVRELAALHPNIAPRFVHVQPGVSLFEHHDRLWQLGASPERNPDATLYMQAVMTRAAADGVGTLLTGARGNFFFSVDGPDWLVALLRARRLGQLAREVDALSRVSGAPRRRVVRRHLLAPLQPRLLRRLRRRPDPIAAWLAYTALRPSVVGMLDLPALLPQLDPGRAADRRTDRLIAAWNGGAQGEMALAQEALFGVELRDPTGDRRLVEAALGQPEWVRRRDGLGRAVAREAMSDRLPESIVRRRVRGEQLPDWLDCMTAARHELASEVDAMAQHGPSRELIDVDRLRGLLGAWPDRGRRADPAVVRDYRYALFRAVLVSRYLRWFEDGGRA
jgi:asparagine synthase (glutamine-hydrolysing)